MNKLKQDKDIGAAMGNLLRMGVIISSVVVFIGGIIYLIRHGHETPAFHVFQGDTSIFRTLPDIITGVGTGKGRAIIQVGIMLLIATPVARIIFSVIGFIQEKDRLYVGITLLVLAIIVTSLLTGAKI